MPAPFQLKDSATNFYFGPPQDTFYSRNPAYQSRYEDVSHLIDSGRLFHVFGDWEATGANRETDQPWQGGFLAFDLNMRLVGRLGMQMAVADIHQMAIQAALVSRVGPDEVKKGWPGYIGLGMYQDFLRATSKPDGAILGLEERNFPEGDSAYIYPLSFPDAGRIEIEIQKSGGKFRRTGSEDWKKRIYSHVHYFNGDGYDVFLASHASARYNFSSLFQATRRSQAAIHADPLALSKWVWAFGPQGKYGLQLSSRHHHKTRRQVLSLRQNDVLLANSPAAYRALGREGGVRLHDGREYDPELAHGALPDAAGTAALYVLLRQIDPDGVRFVENMANEHTQKNFLQGNTHFSDRPLVGFVHYDEGMLSRGIGFLVETGDTHGQMRKNEILLFNASAHDPETVSKLTDSELRAALVQKHDRVVIPQRTNRTCQFADFDRAYKAGAGAHLTPDDYQRRRLWLMNHRHTIWRIMTTWSDLTNPPRSPNLVTTRPPQADSYVHYGDLERVTIKDQASGTWVKEPKDIYRRFEKKWGAVRAFDACLKKFMKPHAVEYSEAPDALKDYLKRFKKLQKELDRLQATWLHKLTLPASPLPTTNEEAIKHIWELRAFLHDKLFNYLPERFIQNERGQNLSIEDAMRVPYALRRQFWQDEDSATGASWKCVFERNENLSTFRLIRMVFEADPFYRQHPLPKIRAWWPGFFEKNFGACRDWYDAEVTLKVLGPPNLDPSQHPYMTAAKRAEEIERIKNTAASGPGSDYERFVAGIPQGPQLLAAWEKETQQVLERQSWTREKLNLVGYNPDTKFPRLHEFFEVPRNNVVRLTVPDSMLDNPQWNPYLTAQHHLVVANPASDLRHELKTLDKTGKSLLLVGEATGITRLAAKAFVAPVPDTAAAHDAVRVAESAYATIGQKLGQHPFLLTFEQLPPVHNERPVKEAAQQVALSSLDWAALVDARAGSLPTPLKPLTGLIVRHVGQNFTKGAVRLRRLSKGEETGDEYQGVLATAECITADDLARLRDRDAWRFGKPTAADLLSQWKRTFADLGIRDPAKQTLWMLRLTAPVDKRSYAYFKRDELPAASFTPARPPDLPRNNLNPRSSRKEAA